MRRWNQQVVTTAIIEYGTTVPFDFVAITIFLRRPSSLGLIVEHEAIDPSVPTRAEIKLKSKQAVEAYLRLE